MTSKAEWLALAERCKKATGSDRETDATLASTLGRRVEWHVESGGYKGHSNLHPVQLTSWGGEEVPSYTASLDAITALIERELPEVTGIIPLTGGDEAWLWPKSGNPKGWRCNAASPALALCAAFCRAMAEKEPT
jgi:hypothetical protein